MVSSRWTWWAQPVLVRRGCASTRRQPARGPAQQKIEHVPLRTYPESSRRSRPGAAGIGSRAWASSWQGFSSMHTTGTAGSCGRAQTAKTSSIRAANPAFGFGRMAQHFLR